MPTYRLDCTLCSFGETVDGDIDAVLDRIDEHREAVASDEDGPDHFVEFEIVGW